MTIIFKTRKPMFGRPVGTELVFDSETHKYTIEGTGVWFMAEEILAGKDFFEEEPPIIPPIILPEFEQMPLMIGKKFLYWDFGTEGWGYDTFNPNNHLHVLYQSLGLTIQDNHNGMNRDRMDHTTEVLMDIMGGIRQGT